MFRMQPQTPRAVMIRLLIERSVKTGKFTLASGKESDFFIDCKQSVLSALGHAVAGRLMLKAVADRFREAEAVAGVELGGYPLASSVSLLSTMTDFRDLSALYVRKAQKNHGSSQRVEGKASVEAGSKVVLLKDVVTMGGSSLRAVAALREEEYDVIGVIALVDRLEGAAQAFEEAEVPFLSVLTRENLVPKK